MKLVLEAAGLVVGLAVTLYCFGYLALNIAEFLMLPVRVLVAIFI